MEKLMSINRPSRETMNGEITRLGELLGTTERNWEMKKFIGSLANMEETPSEQYTKCKNYYISAIHHLKQKICFWTQYRESSFDEDALVKIQESLDEWITNGWNYLGMEGHRAEAENAKEESQLFRLMYETTPKEMTPIQKTKSRGNKKSRRNKKK